MKRLFFPITVLLALVSVSPAQEKSNRPDAATRAAQLLKRFPESDTNKDGTLTREEAMAFLRKRRGESGDRPRKPRVEPTVPDVAYGDHEQQKFDIWPIEGATAPTPLVILIHGGGFRGGDKSSVSPQTVAKYKDAGIAFASMNYRLTNEGEFPYPTQMEDAARGLQTIRHRASEWNIDPNKIACYGGSAGAGISLWLGFHDDLANPDSEDPIARESTRIVASGTMNGQSTYDLRTFRKWFEVPNLIPDDALFAFYKIENDEDWESERVQKLMTDASPISHLTKDDVPVYMTYGRPNTKVTYETRSGEWVHHVLLGLKLQEAMKELGLECTVRGPDIGEDADPYGSLEDFFVAKLKE